MSSSTINKSKRFVKNSKRDSGSTSQPKKSPSRTNMSSQSMQKPFVPSINRG